MDRRLVGWIGSENIIRHRLSLGHAPRCREDSGMGGMEGADGFDANARGSARYDKHLVTKFAFETLVLQNLKGSRPSVARALRCCMGGGVARHDGGLVMVFSTRDV